MLACRDALSLTIADIALGVAIFFIGELILSRLLYQLHLRDRPY
jgi:CDP-2,3-bis-(O-geranylgeranyl)-sn-glycerol synthase